MATQTDHELIYAAKSGDRQAFSVLVERHYTLMFKMAWKWSGNRADAEDIAQEAAIKLARHIDSFEFQSAFTTWLCRIVINAAKDLTKAAARQNSRELPLYEDMAYIDKTPNAEEQMQQKDVLKALSSLSEELRETVILVCWQGMTHKEAGDVMACAEGTVSWRVHEARKKMIELISVEEGGKRHG